VERHHFQTPSIIIGPTGNKTNIKKKKHTHTQGDTKGSRGHSWFTLKVSNGQEKRGKKKNSKR